MRIVLASLAALGAALTAPAARADELYSQSLPAGASDFSGAEVGLNLGAGMGANGPVNTSGMAAGFNAGYNLQNGPIVGGLAGDVLLGDISGGSSNASSYSYSSLSSARVHAGYAMGPLLMFGSLGGAFATSRQTTPGGYSNKSLTGYVLGIGAEYAVARNVSLRAEFSHYDFGDVTYYAPPKPTTVNATQNLITLGIAAHF
ncbi:MAG: outer membrane protein [Roseiarcus sp.]